MYERRYEEEDLYGYYCIGELCEHLILRVNYDIGRIDKNKRSRYVSIKRTLDHNWEISMDIDCHVYDEELYDDAVISVFDMFEYVEVEGGVEELKKIVEELKKRMSRFNIY
jgi:hypothetical protein